MIARKLALTAAITIALTFTATVSADGEGSHSHDDDAALAGPVAAVVNGKPISSLLADRVAGQLASQGQKATREQIVDELINLELLTQEAEKLELDKQDDIAAALNLQYTQTMANAYLANYSDTITISEEDIRAEYDTQVAKMKSEEFNASHILLETEEDAKNVITELQNGGDFAELAKTKSTGPTGPSGGELGWFTRDSMVPEFSAAVADLEVGGATAAPVKTEFGWHVIKLNDKRSAAKPDYSDEVKASIENTLMRQKIAEHILSLRDTVSVEIK